jgi:NTE family protein
MKRPKIGLVLGSGGARGYAHIGVLKVLKQHEIPIDYIAGSSMGSIIGVLYANQLNLDLLSKLASFMKRKHLVDFSVPKMGLIRGDRIKELIRLLTHGKRLEQLSIPTAVVATNLLTGEPVVFKEGPIDEAVRASISIPGIFEPVQWGDQLLVDGGVVDRVPIQPVKEMGADLVIAVDVAPIHLQASINSVYEVITQSIDIMEREIYKHRLIDADVVIRPDVGHHSITNFNNVESVIHEGEESALQYVAIIKQLIEEWDGKDAQKN